MGRDRATVDVTRVWLWPAPVELWVELRVELTLFRGASDDAEAASTCDTAYRSRIIGLAYRYVPEFGQCHVFLRRSARIALARASAGAGRPLASSVLVPRTSGNETLPLIWR